MSLGQPNSSRRPDGAALVIAVILAAIAAVIFWQTSQMRVPPIQARIGPTVFPYVVASALVLLSIGTAISAIRRGFPERSDDNYVPIFWIVGGLVAQLLLAFCLPSPLRPLAVVRFGSPFPLVRSLLSSSGSFLPRGFSCRCPQVLWKNSSPDRNRLLWIPSDFSHRAL
jgi:hypothetical protein